MLVHQRVSHLDKFSLQLVSGAKISRLRPLLRWRTAMLPRLDVAPSIRWQFGKRSGSQNWKCLPFSGNSRGTYIWENDIEFETTWRRDPLPPWQFGLATLDSIEGTEFCSLATGASTPTCTCKHGVSVWHYPWRFGVAKNDILAQLIHMG